MTEICKWTAVETAERIRRRDVSVVEVTRAHIARMEAINPEINAITTPVSDAMETARALDNAPQDARAKPLFGVPVTTKINVDQAGYPNSNGVPAFKDATGPQDAPVVANLKAADTVIIGRTNTPEFSMRWSTSNPLHGVSTNPWNAAVTPGGSSGAAAAAVACGIGAIAHGNDLGGSLRYPAFCCGVAAIRPSFGRVPAANPNQPTERPPLTQTMSVQGPIARTIADVRAALDVMAGRDARDPLWVNAANSGRVRGTKLRIGYAVNPFGGHIDPEVEKAMAIAVAGFKDCGVEMVETTAPIANEGAQLWGDILLSETNVTTRPVIREHGSEPMNRLLDAYFERYAPLEIAEFVDALTRRIQYQRAWALMFDQIDLFMMPTSMIAPFENDLDFKYPAEIPAILDAQKPLQLVNLLGLPAAAVPTHVTDQNVPVGVQLVGPMHDDMFVLDGAELLEQQIGTIWQNLGCWSS